ncbi:MAG: restriction endonuclease [Lachnospiraceae bacterium]|nr:restriction endonuclease [Lachnospiraceae bacterium]
MEMKITPSTELIAVAAAVLFVTAVFIWLFFRRRNRAEDMFEDMEGHEFEYFCADLLKRNGFTEVEVTKGSGDYGADILAQKEGVTYAVQCKCYTGPVGVGAVQEVYAGRDYYDRMVGAVMTNQYFTSPAVKAAEKLKILLWDGGCLESMMDQ